VSALRATDLDPDRLKARGALMLRDFLAYAESRGNAGDEDTLFAAATLTHDPLRHDLAERLRRQGLTVHEDYGTANHRIDIAVEDPYHRGRALIAVETDGERYAALRSTRDRDRLRPEQLARLGWLHERVWSTDVFRDPAREIARLVTLARDFSPAAAAPEPSAEDGDDAGAGQSSGHGGAGPGEDGSDGGEGGSAVPGSGDRPEVPDGASGDRAEDPTPAPKRKRRRVFRKGTGAAAGASEPDSAEPATSLRRSSDELDLGWVERPSGSGVGDQGLEEQRPPHYE